MGILKPDWDINEGKIHSIKFKGKLIFRLLSDGTKKIKKKKGGRLKQQKYVSKSVSTNQTVAPLRPHQTTRMNLQKTKKSEEIKTKW